MHIKLRMGRTARDCRIEIDGEPVVGVTGIAIAAEVNGLPVVTLTFHPESVEVEGETNVEVKK